MRRISRGVVVVFSVMLVGLGSSAFAGDKSADGASGHGIMKGGSCPESLAAKRLLYKRLKCDSDPDDEDCKELAAAIEEKECECGDPKPAPAVCKKYEK
jgi:hypothetical protein